MKRYIVTALVIMVAMGPGMSMAQSKKLAAQIMQQGMIESKKPNETRATLEPSLFSGQPQVQAAYRAAQTHRGALDKVFCYCYCAMNPQFKHKSLLTCYTDGHASKCGVCIKQALLTKQWTDQGKTPEEIALGFREMYMK